MKNVDGCPFVLKSNAAFAQRQKNIFGQISHLESNRKSSQSKEESMDVDDSPASRKADSAMTKQLRGKESLFKRPQDPITKNFIRRMPDFKKNPHKWIKYSLDDVKAEDMSEESNTRAAWSFINELRNRKNKDSQKEQTDEAVPDKIVFKKRTPVAKKSDEELKPTFRNSKVVMPEYVVGQQKTKKEKKNHLNRTESTTSSSSKQLKLDHLFEEEND